MDAARTAPPALADGGAPARRRACPACAAAEPQPWRADLDRCPRCGTAVTALPAPPGAHDLPPPCGASLAAPVLDLFDRHRLRLLHRVATPPGTLLDAGAGRGRFVVAARGAGWEASGLEPAARDSVVPLHRTSIERAAVAPASLDAVVLWHVLEHVEDPGTALAAVRAWLRPGGGLLVGVPNLASLQAALGGRLWFHLDVPRHRTHFTPGGLRSLLVRSGFAVAGEHHVLLEHNPFGMWQTLVNRATGDPSYLFALLKRTAPLRARALAASLAALPLAPAAALVELGAGLARRGGTMAVIARRADG